MPKKKKPSVKAKTSMTKIGIGKLVLNMGVGEVGPKLEKAEKLLERISGMKPIRTKAKKRVPTWGLRPGLEIGLKCTLRGKRAIELLKRLLEGMENRILAKNFDREGNLNFGIKEYISIPDVDYDPSVGIVGFNVSVCLERPGYRVKSRRANRSKVGRKQRVSKEDAISFMKKQFGIEVVE